MLTRFRNASSSAPTTICPSRLIRRSCAPGSGRPCADSRYARWRANTWARSRTRSDIQRISCATFCRPRSRRACATGKATSRTNRSARNRAELLGCDQFLRRKISEPRLIAAWLSGYYNAKRNNRVIDLQTFEENMSKVTNYCSDEKNFKVPVMKAVEQVLGKSH